MNTEKAIKLLREMQEAWKLQITGDAFDALEMAITALENAKNDNLTPESAQNVQKQALKMQKSDALGAKTGETCSDTISRQAAIDFIDAGHLCNPNEPRWSDNEVVNFLKSRPSAQPETCDTCKHGYFGDEQCNDCRVRFTSHYERRTK